MSFAERIQNPDPMIWGVMIIAYLIMGGLGLLIERLFPRRGKVFDCFLSFVGALVGLVSFWLLLRIWL